MRDFLGIVGVPLERYLEAVSVGGFNTHRWRLEAPREGKGGKTGKGSLPMFIPRDILNKARSLQEAGTLPSICSALYKVKYARIEGNEFYVPELHTNARVVASILVTDMAGASEDEFADLLDADAASREPPTSTRRAAAATLAEGVRALTRLAEEDVPDDDDGDDASEITAETLNFVTAFSNMAVADDPKGGAGGPPRTAEEKQRQADRRRLQKLKKKEAKAAKETKSREAHDTAAAASEADP